MDDAQIQLLKPATIGVIPTDTVYGVVARATDKKAVERLYKLKHREQKPGTLIASSLEQLEELGLKHRYLKAVEQYWPNPVSVVIPCVNPDLEYLHQGKMSLAVRLPKGKQLQNLLNKVGPLLTSSANQPGEPPANTITEARQYFGDQVDFYAEGGDISNNKPSTVIRVVDDAVEVLREGSFPIGDDTISS